MISLTYLSSSENFAMQYEPTDTSVSSASTLLTPELIFCLRSSKLYKNNIQKLEVNYPTNWLFYTYELSALASEWTWDWGWPLTSFLFLWKSALNILVSIRITWIDIIKQEGLHQNKFKSSHVCTRNFKMDYWYPSSMLAPVSFWTSGWKEINWTKGFVYGQVHTALDEFSTGWLTEHFVHMRPFNIRELKQLRRRP